ncbi:MAG: hypothetical protein AB8C95_11155 [Phycisphaeraceae bacterium]
MTAYSSKAWLLDGPIHSCPGILHLAEGRLNYLILEPGTFSDKGIKKLLTRHGKTEDTPLDYPLELFSHEQSEVTRFHVPWYYFGAGGKLDFKQTKVRFSFIRPENTVEPTYYSEAFRKYMGGTSQQEVSIAEGRKAGKQWKALLNTP